MTIKAKISLGFLFIIVLLCFLLAISYVTNSNIEEKNTTINTQITASDNRFTAFNNIESFREKVNRLIQNILKSGYAITQSELDIFFDEITKDLSELEVLVDINNFESDFKKICLGIKKDANSLYNNKK